MVDGSISHAFCIAMARMATSRNASSQLRTPAAASAEKRALSQVFFYWCHRTKERMRATSAVVHPMDAVAPACAAAEEGVASTAQLTSVQPLSRGRPRGRAAANSMDVISATAAATPLEPHGTVTAM